MIENQKKIWITGASSGIGKALALKFAKENWLVAISARRKELLDELSQNENIFSFPLDVTDDQLVKTTFTNILSKFKTLDICVFCSGTYNRKSEKFIDISQIKETFEINFFGTVNCVKAVEQYLKIKRMDIFQ